VSLADAHREGGTARWQGTDFRRFQGGEARVDAVYGEVYWEVAVGEKVRTTDYVAPPRMLSLERSDKEAILSVGTYVPKAEVEAAFGLPQPLRTPRGVAPHQPNPYEAARTRLWKCWAVLAGLAVALAVAFHARAANAVVFDGSFSASTPGDPAPPGVPGGGEAHVAFSEPFTLAPSVANVRIDVKAPLSNAWLGVDGSLVNLDDGQVFAFEVEAERWSGVEGGEAWSEGDGEGTVYLGSVPAGRYALRLEPVTSGSVAGYQVLVRSQVPSFFRPFLLVLLLLLPPLLASILSSLFERRRWSESGTSS
jgi:hypothetical protein